MDPMTWMMLLGGGSGLLKSLKSQKDQKAHDKYRAALVRYAPWTGMKDPGAMEAQDPLGGILQGAAMGGLIGGMLPKGTPSPTDIDTTLPGTPGSTKMGPPDPNKLPPGMPGSTQMGPPNPAMIPPGMPGSTQMGPPDPSQAGVWQGLQPGAQAQRPMLGPDFMKNYYMYSLLNSMGRSNQYG